MTNVPFASIVIPCRNEERFIRSCLESILGNDYPPGSMEVLVVDGMSTDGTRSIIAEFEQRDARVRLLENLAGITPSALNVGIRAARGEVILRMDAHNQYPAHYISRLVRWLERSGADNVGGVCHTIPANGSLKARAIAIALSHPFAVGDSHFRIGSSEPRWVDTVPFGCFRRSVFDRIGMFDEELVRNQDDELNHRLLKHGGRILLVPNVTSKYFARESFGKLGRMLYQYGYFKPLTALKLGRVLTLRQLVPPLFVLGVFAALVAIAAGGPLRMLALAGLALYAAATIVFAIVAGARHGAGVVVMLILCFLVVHLSYGLGFLRGAWDFLLLQRRIAQPATIALTR